MLSMTGYGTARVVVRAASIVVEARAFNHRFLDVRIKLPGPLQDHVSASDEIARKLLSRGRVEISGRLEGQLGQRVSLNRARATAALNELRELGVELGAAGEVPLSLLALVPGLFVEESSADADEIGAAVVEATTAACQALIAMRRSEGDALRRDLETRLQRIASLTADATARAVEWTLPYRERLRARLTALLEDRKVALDGGRLEHELALLAERSDVSEELTRLASHCAQFAAALPTDDAPCGRRLEFLLQEMAREANTLGAKSADLRMTACSVEMKTELERMREQLQNVL